ncbi:hypothetical protein, partial [Klebsiella pneumoniae]
WLMMSLWDALRMNMMISYQELVRTFPNKLRSLVLPGGALLARAYGEISPLSSAGEASAATRRNSGTIAKADLLPIA